MPARHDNLLQHKDLSIAYGRACHSQCLIYLLSIHDNEKTNAAGRLLHHLEEVEGLSLKAVQVCILDEADRLFELGLFEQVSFKLPM